MYHYIQSHSRRAYDLRPECHTAAGYLRLDLRPGFSRMALGMCPLKMTLKEIVGYQYQIHLPYYLL